MGKSNFRLSGRHEGYYYLIVKGNPFASKEKIYLSEKLKDLVISIQFNPILIREYCQENNIDSILVERFIGALHEL